MAGRSFKPASYLASAAPTRSPRPSFARTGSSSSNKSDDSFVATFRSLAASDAAAAARENERKSAAAAAGTSSPHGIAPGTGSPVSGIPIFDDTPSRKRSKPIAIELPPRNTATAYTPLTGRGDYQKGGYFPDHVDFAKSYRSKNSTGSLTPGSPSNMSASSSQMSSPTQEVTPRGPTSLLSPTLDPAAPLLGFPVGKYHPSNYNPPASTAVSTPTAPLPPTNLSIPPTTSHKTKRQKSSHERNSSDVKRKLQQYQRDMIAQARLATALTGGQLQVQIPKPVTPDLVPIGSPGPCTPFDLEDSGGYIAAGTRRRASSLIGKGLEKEKQIAEEAIEIERKRAEERRVRN